MDQAEINPNTIPSSSPEVSPNIPVAQPGDIARPEVAPKAAESGHEQLPNPEQRTASQGASLPPVQPPPLADDSQTAVNTTAATTSVLGTPLIADDVDVIEMEWVNKAKKIIKDNKDDPHAQERAVEQLQIDYLKKRYGKEIRSSRSDQ